MGETARITGSVEVIETMKNDIFVCPRTGESQLISRMDTNLMPHLGQYTVVMINLEKSRLFDEDMGKSLF